MECPIFKPNRQRIGYVCPDAMISDAYKQIINAFLVYLD